jgi:hypothetical protein
METLNLEALHKVPELLKKHGSFPRRIGKTTYAIQAIINTLYLFEDETICVLVNNADQLDHFLYEFHKACDKEGLDAMWHEAFRRIWFTNNTNHVKFFTANTLSIFNPMDAVKQKSYNNYIITDLNNMPPSFYYEELTVENAHLLNKYKDYLTNGL